MGCKSLIATVTGPQRQGAKLSLAYCRLTLLHSKNKMVLYSTKSHAEELLKNH